MGKIINIVSNKKLKEFKRLFNNKNSNPKYFIDSQKNTNEFIRLFGNTNNSEMTALATNTTWEGVKFENPSDFNLSVINKPSLNEDNIFVAEYKATGSVSTLTEEQREVYGTATVAGETKFVVVSYSDNFENAKSRQTYWTTSKESTDKIGYAGLKNVNGNESTVLGIEGPGTVNNGAQYWNVVILDKASEDGNIIAHYIFDFSSIIKAKPIATFDNENYYHKVEGNINQEDYSLTDSEEAFNAITNNNPIYPSEHYNQDRLYCIFTSGGGPLHHHYMQIYPRDRIYQGGKSIGLCKTSSYTDSKILSGRVPDEDMYSNNVFARFYNVPSEDNTSYVLYYALVGED